MSTGLLDPEFLIGASLADGRFKIVARVGAGSMAVVYRAFDHRLETDVVVKVPKQQKLLDPGLRERFRRESRLLVQLQHPHIVRIFDIGVYASIPYVVMQYLSGGCLLDRLQSRDGRPMAMKISSIRDWLQPVSKALDYAHLQKIVHRDVKPANILFDHVGNAYLSDFGLTKIMHGDPTAEEADETGAGLVVGTPNYVAPEIVLGKDYDGTADQYSLAMTVFHTLVGQPPMQGKTPSATMVNQTRRTLPLLSDIRKAVPLSLAEAVEKALSKNPKNRFTSCSSFADAAIAALIPSTGATERASNPSLSEETSAVQESSPQSRDRTSNSLLVRQKPTQPIADGRQRPPEKQPIRQSVSAKPGILSCPICTRSLRLRAEHAGRVGKCVQCQTRLLISTDLCMVQCREDLASSSSVQRSEASSEDLLIGTTLFGLQMSRNVLVTIGLIMLLLSIIGTAILLNQWTGVDLEKERQKILLENSNREG